MRNGDQLINGKNGNNFPSFELNRQLPANQDLLPQNLNSQTDPKENAQLVFDQKWQDSKAAGIKRTLTANVFGEKNAPTEKKPSLKTQNERAENLLRHNWKTLIDTAKNHKDLADYHHQSKDFWNNTRQMSEIQIVERYLNGKTEQHITSRYGELLEKFTRSGKTLEVFLNTLSPNERNVFHARYQINQLLGANELFLGNGIALEKNGKFPLSIFLSINGITTDTLPNSLLGFRGMSAIPLESLLLFENIHTFSNGQFLINTGNAALLGLSIALYQNAGVMLSLQDVAFESFPLPKITNEQSVALPNGRSEAGKIHNSLHQINEITLAVALISGALTEFEKYRKAKHHHINSWMEANSELAGYYFSAGATGAMLGATIGCVVPLAEKSIGEVLGFATSIVIGLEATGSQRFSSNTLVSVLKNSLQNLLENFSVKSSVEKILNENPPMKYLNEAKPNSIFEDDLQRQIFYGRTNAYLAS